MHVQINGSNVNEHSTYLDDIVTNVCFDFHLFGSKHGVFQALCFPNVATYSVSWSSTFAETYPGCPAVYLYTLLRGGSRI